MEASELIQTVIVFVLPVLFAITLHEAAHGYVARHFGDFTAWKLGRVTLNPARHIDPFGTILMPLLLYVATSGDFLFGYARPVPVVFSNLKRPKHDMIWVALAGPAANFIQAIGWAVLLFGLLAAGTHEGFFVRMAHAGILVNLVMWAFNLIPVPPLDGGRVLSGLLPRGTAQDVLARVEPFGFLIVVGLVLAGIAGAWWLAPMVNSGFSLIAAVIGPLASLFGK